MKMSTLRSFRPVPGFNGLVGADVIEQVWKQRAARGQKSEVRSQKSEVAG